MQLYILRHGIALDRPVWIGSDFTRPLTVEGIQKTRAVIENLQSKRDLKVDAIWSSPLVRALQTATVASEVLGGCVETVEVLASGTNLSNVLAYMAQQKRVPERLMWVGHEPDCSIMTSELVGDTKGCFEFKKAGMASLEGVCRRGAMKLEWLVPPKDIL